MSWLYTTPIAVLAVVLFVSLLAALEIGRRIGGRVEIAEPQLSTIAAPILALVGLLLAFSFSMAGDRFELRRAAAVQETNSIGTFWLRTSLMPEPTRSELRVRLRRYVDLHIQHRLAGIDEARTAELEVEIERVQQELWALVAEDARRDPEAARVRLVVPALNAVLDDAASVLAARENRLPDAIFFYLFLLVVSAGVVVGYRPRGEKRNVVLWLIFTVVVSGVLVILLDMDRPRRGLIETHLGPYLRLREAMQHEPP